MKKKRKGRITGQVDDAIEMLHEEGTIIVPMNEEQYKESKDYSFTIIEQIHEVTKNINFPVQRRLFEQILEKLKHQNKKVTSIPDEGIIRLK